MAVNVAPSQQDFIRRGVYDADYFSGAQVAVYIGDVWVDEITSLEFSVVEPRVPLYGYADTNFVDVSRGQVLVSGSFSINFKEAGYLWLILNRFKQLQGKKTALSVVDGSLLDPTSPYTGGNKVTDKNIEEAYVKNSVISKAALGADMKSLTEQEALLRIQSKLTGYASSARAGGNENIEMTGAENIFEAYEDKIWGKKVHNGEGVNSTHRRAMDIKLNPFDIYITYGDYTGDNRLHHTVQKLQKVYIVSCRKQITIDGSPIQELYQFIAQDLI